MNIFHRMQSYMLAVLFAKSRSTNLKSCKLCKYYFKTGFGFERCKVDAVELNHANVFMLCEEMKKGKCGKDSVLFKAK